jgi:periplasmic protein TonB
MGVSPAEGTPVSRLENRAKRFFSAVCEVSAQNDRNLWAGVLPRIRRLFMRSAFAHDSFSPAEIAQAAGVAEDEVVALAGYAREGIPHDEAVRIGRLLVQRSRGVTASAAPGPLFGLFSASPASGRRTGVPLALSSTVHAGLIAFAVFLATFDLNPRAASLRPDDRPVKPMPLVFVATPGPGGGGGGGGLLQKAPPPKALREGARKISSPIPERREPKPLRAIAAPPEPIPVLKTEPLPQVMAPIVPAPADLRTRPGVLQQATVDAVSRGPGSGGGAGTGTGAGIGEGDGSGIGPGSGGGTGGGPYRPGSGIEPPRLLREVKADYTEDARRRSVSGDVVLEIVVRRDGTVGDVKILQGLAGGLNDRAVQAVRQWRFTPARRQGAAVDVVVEVAVEFKLR